MKKVGFGFVFLSFILMSVCGEAVAQSAQETIAGAVEADSVKISRSDKRKARRDAEIRKKSRMLTRDLLEHGRLQFEPEVGFYHGNQINLNAGHYTKTFSNSLNSLGYVNGWHEDESGGKYSGKPVLQILNGRFYCNLEPVITTSRQEIIGTRARDKAAAGSFAGVVDNDFESSDEKLSNWHAFNTEYFKIVNYKELGDYRISFDVIVNQFNIISNSSYDHFKFECILNYHDGRMVTHIVAGETRSLATYFGYINILRGNSF